VNDSKKKIQFIPSGRGKARCAPDPLYPNGIAVPKPPGSSETCLIELPYPAPECGVYLITCKLCGSSMAITAVGRPDDPVSCHMPCKMKHGVSA
jgi:hypothetical protein